MRSRLSITALLWLASLGSAVVAASRIAGALGSAPVLEHERVERRAIGLPVRDSLASLVSDAQARTPFNVGHAVAELPVVEPDPVQQPPAVGFFPEIRVHSIVGGPPWSAALSGFPALDGTQVVRSGDRVGGVLILAIAAEAVVVHSNDTTRTVRLQRGTP